MSPVSSFDIPKTTTYKDNFLSWDMSKADSMKPDPKVMSNISYKGNYLSQYESNFKDKGGDYKKCIPYQIPGLEDILLKK